MTARRLGRFCLVTTLLAGCGGAAPATAALTAQARAKKQDVAEPLRDDSEEALHAALVAASQDVPPLLRLIDPDRGVGTYDAGDTGIAHHCSRDEYTTHPGMAFAVHENDRLRCDRDRRRCAVAARDGGGYAFYFRRASGGAVTLDAIIHYRGRQLPNRDSRAITAFADGGDGVCAFRRSLRPGAPAPRRFSVFVAHHTGLVTDTVSSHLCGDEAVAAYQERVAPLLGQADGFECTRAPTRCSLRRGDEDVVIHGDASGPRAVTVTRHGMFPNLARAQERDRAAFERGIAGHSCDAATP